MTDDPTLLRRFAEERREEDFAELVRRHLGLVYRAALRRTDGDAHLAEDVSQQVFTALAQDANRVLRHPVLAGWLYVTTRHAAANAMRTEQRRRRREQEAGIMNELTIPDNPGAEWERIRPELDRVMDELPERDRHAVLLRYFENKPFGEIGEMLRLSENAARMRVDRALERLRDLLEKRGIVSTSAALAALLGNQAAAAVPNTLATTITGAAMAGGATVAMSGGFIAYLTTTKMIGIAAAAACIVAGVAVYEAREERALQAAQAEGVRQGGEGRRELQRVRARIDEAGKRVAQAKDEDAALLKRRAELLERQRAVSNQSLPTVNLTPTKITELLADDPQMRHLWMAQARLKLLENYTRVKRAIGLTDEQVGEMVDSMIALEQERMDVWAALRAQGLGTDDPEFKRLSELADEPRQEVQARAQRRILGEAKYREFVSASRTPTPTGSRLASDLFYTDTPLTVAQARQLDELLYTHSTEAGAGRKADWETVYEKAAAVLSAPQIAMLRRSVEMQRLSKRLNEIQKEEQR